MKNSLIIIATLTASISFGQKLKPQEVPSNLKEAFQKQYPQAVKPKWVKEGNNYEVEFQLASEEMSVVLENSGQILETETEIDADQLPKEAISYVKTKYKATIKEAPKITDAKGVITYEAEVKGIDLIFDVNGKFIEERKK